LLLVVWWICAAIAGAGLVVLGVSTGLLLSRLRAVRDLQRTLRSRVEGALALQEPVQALQARVEAMQEQMIELQTRLEARAARREAAG
jgi:hypothetical protein